MSRAAPLDAPLRRAGAAPGPASATVRRPRAVSVLLPGIIAAVVMVPLLVPRLPGNSVPVDVLNVGIMLVGGVALWNTRAPIRVPFALGYLLLIAGGTFATIASVDPMLSMLVIVQDVYLFAWFVVMLNVILLEGERGARMIATGWAITGTIVGGLVWGVTLLYPNNVVWVFGNRTVDFFNRSNLTFRDPNMAASYLALSLFVLWASPRPARRGIKILMTVPILLGIYATQSITGLVVVGAGIAVAATLALVRSSQRAAVAVAVAIAGVSLAVVAALPPDTPRRATEAAERLGESETFSRSLGRTTSSLGPRLTRYEEALTFFGSDIILGIGPGTTNEALIARDAPISGELHNDYIASFLERGLVGGIGAIMVFAAATLWTLRAAVAPGLRRRGWRNTALFGGMTVILLSALSLEVLHFRHLWLFLALACGLGIGRGRPLDRPR